jgi:putative sigma-54 modulation protein
MNIEFFAPQDEVNVWVLDYVKEKLLEFHEKDHEISVAAVHFREERGSSQTKKICEISLTIYGDNIFVHRDADSFEQASQRVIAELSSHVDEQVKRKNEPPDQLTSTVDV